MRNAIKNSDNIPDKSYYSNLIGKFPQTPAWKRVDAKSLKTYISTAAIAPVARPSLAIDLDPKNRGRTLVQHFVNHKDYAVMSQSKAKRQQQT